MKIRILTPVQHDGQRLEPGDYIEIKDADARGLIEIGAAESVGKGKADKTTVEDEK